MPRRRRRIIKGMKGTPPGFSRGRKVGHARSGGKATPPPAGDLYPGWAPGDRWGPGPNDVIPGGPPDHTPKGDMGGRPRGRPKPKEGGGRDFNPPSHIRPKPPTRGEVNRRRRPPQPGPREGGGRPRPTRPPVGTNPPDADGGYRTRPRGGPSSGGRGGYLGPPTPVGKSGRKKPSAGGIEVYGTGERITPYKVGEKRVHSAGTSTPKRKRKGASTGSRY